MDEENFLGNLIVCKKGPKRFLGNSDILEDILILRRGKKFREIFKILELEKFQWKLWGNYGR